MLLPVIFVSDCQKMREYAYQELNCIGYQPFEFDDVKLNELVKKGLHYTTVRDEKAEVYLKEKTLMHPVRVKDIVYIESHSHGLCFRLKSGMALEVKNRTLPDVKEKIKNQCLLQCGRNVIVNRDYIETLKDKTLILRNGTDSVAIPVGVRFRQLVKIAVL